MNTKQLFKGFLALGLLGGASSLIAPTEAFAQGSATVGSLRGVLKDKATGEAAVGATVVATSPALVGEQVVITDETGQYFINSLPPGLYTLTIYYNNQPFSRQGVLISLGKEAVVNVTVDSAATTGANGGGTKGEVIEIKGTVPIIDQGSTKTGLTLTDDYTRNIPTGRTFAGVLGSAAGSQNDLYGVSLAGAGSAENVYLVEGINTTDTGFGGVSSNLPNEFIAETEVITGGYNAEFGRATGGIVNVVTKQGSNTIKGSVFGYLTPGSFVADAKTIQREGSSVDSQANLSYDYDIGGEVGGPIIKDKLWFHVGLNPQQVKTTVTRFINRQVDNDQDGVPDIDPDTGFTTREEVFHRDIDRKLTTYFFTAKINGAIDQNNQFQISAFGNPRSGTGVSLVDGFGAVNSPDYTQFAFKDGAYDVAAKWTSKFSEGKTQVDAVVGYHHSYQNVDPKDEAHNVAAVQYGFPRSLFDFAPLEGGDAINGCHDSMTATPDDPYPGIVNCPITLYKSQGYAFMGDRVNDRTTAALSVTQRVKAVGYHTFKGGVDVDFSTYNNDNFISGAGIYTQGAPNPNLPPDQTPRWTARELMRVINNVSRDMVDADGDGVPDDTDGDGIPDVVASVAPGDKDAVLCVNNNAVCTVAKDLPADTNNRGYAAFIQDSWQVRPNLTLNAGLRWEQQNGLVAKNLQGKISPEGEVIPETAYKLKNELAPRVGFIYDPTQEGKSKVFAHWGRFYENVPMDLNVRSFGGEIQNNRRINPARRSPSDPMFDPACNVQFDAADPTRDLGEALRQCTQRAQVSQNGGGTEFVSPGMKGQYTDELIIGTEYEMVADFKVGVNYIHRILPRVIEDISTDGANSYLITNPGENFDDAAADLRRERDQLLSDAGCMSLDDTGPNCDPTKQSLAALQDSRAKQLDFVKHFDKPSRNYDAVQFQVTQRPTKRSLLQASYTYSVSKGNYPGLFSTETGQLDPNITSLYDLPDLMANRYGPMGLDRPHNVKIDGFYQFPLGKMAVLTTGASLRALSGIAHNTLASHPVYGPNEAYILPRGAVERSPVTFQTDIHVSAGWKVNKSTLAEGFIRVFNLFDAQDELTRDEQYTINSAEPIVGGDTNDLKHLKIIDDNTGTEANRTPLLNKNFGKLDSRQAPRTIQLGFRLTF